MAVEFNVTLQDKPGTLARLGRTLGEAGVNIEAIQGTSREGHAFVHFVPRDPQQAARILDAAGIGYTQREVLIVRVLDKPGMLGDVALVMAQANINIDSIYVTTNGRLVLGVDDLDGAIQVAAGMAVMAFE
jgi:hypothetical protein